MFLRICVRVNCEIFRMKKFTKNILQIVTGICTMATLCAGKAMALTVREGAEAARAEGMPAELVGVDGVFTRITNTVLYVVGVISVVMLIWGGLRYIMSGGDSKKILASGSRDGSESGSAFDRAGAEKCQRFQSRGGSCRGRYGV